MKMPSAFSDEEFPVFTQTGRSDHSGGDPIRPSESDGGSNGGVTGSFSGQTYLLSDDERFTNFSSVKAHEEALRLDDRYYDAFERGGLVVFASFGQGGSRSLAAGAIREEFSQWHLVIATTGSDFHEARVQQVHTTWLDGHRETTYSLVSSPAPPWDGEMPMAIAGKPFVDPARAYELGDRVFQEPLIGATHASITTNNGIYSFPHVTANDRFWVTAGYKPPDTPADAQVITPWLVTIDASTGAVVRLQTAPEHRGSL